MENEKIVRIRKYYPGKWISEHGGKVYNLSIGDNFTELTIIKKATESEAAETILNETFSSNAHFFSDVLCFMYQNMKYVVIDANANELAFGESKNPGVIGEYAWSLRFYRLSTVQNTKDKLRHLALKLRDVYVGKEDLLSKSEASSSHDFGILQNRLREIESFENAIDEIDADPYLQNEIIKNFTDKFEKIRQRLMEIK